MGLFEWMQQSSLNSKMSMNVALFKCRSTNIVAYYVSNKHIVNSNLDFNGEYEPLKNSNGIYFLMGDKSCLNERPTIYIGQATTRQNYTGMDRIKEHINKTTDWYKDKWDSVLFITSTDNSWSTSLVDTLEFLFIACFKTNKGGLSTLF